MDGVTDDPVAPAEISATVNYLRPGSRRNRLYVALGGHPHTAFEAPYADAANPRESVEFRTIAFFY
jgi:hypothetical protein